MTLAAKLFLTLLALLGLAIFAPAIERIAASADLFERSAQ